jgi:hypothetical protein
MLGKKSNTLGLPVAWTIWLEHAWLSRFLDTDSVFPHYQEREMVRRTPHSTAQTYFMPAQADQSIVALRRWSAAHAPVLGHFLQQLYRLGDTAGSLDAALCSLLTATTVQPWLSGCPSGARALSALSPSLFLSDCALGLLSSCAPDVCRRAVGTSSGADQELHYQDYKHYNNPHQLHLLPQWNTLHTRFPCLVV